MSEISLAKQKEILDIAFSKAVVVNKKGDLSIDGTPLLGIDGERTFKMFIEGINKDLSENGPVKAKEIYLKRSRIPGSLGKVLKSAGNLVRTLDSEDISNILHKSSI